MSNCDVCLVFSSFICFYLFTKKSCFCPIEWSFALLRFLLSMQYFAPPSALLRLFQFSSRWKITMTSQGDFKLSKIEIIIRNNDEDEEEQGPKEVPMFDQTMSILVMIKEQKVIFNLSHFQFAHFSIFNFVWFSICPIFNLFSFQFVQFPLLSDFQFVQFSICPISILSNFQFVQYSIFLIFNFDFSLVNRCWI